jgi:hypothetical protein
MQINTYLARLLNGHMEIVLALIDKGAKFIMLPIYYRLYAPHTLR